MAMNSSFGDYITKEYGLLRQILSYLQPCDLQVARHVCQDWNRAVEFLVNNKLTMVVREVTENATPYFAVNKPILPALVLHKAPGLLMDEKECTKCNNCRKPFILGLCPCSVSGPDTTYISVSYHTCGISCNDLCTKFLAFLLPISKHVQVSVFVVKPKDNIHKRPLTDEIFEKCLGGSDPVKCIFILKKYSGRNTFEVWVKKLLNQVIARQGITFGLGGGYVEDIDKYNMKSKRSWDKCEIVIIALRGDNLTVDCNILQDSLETEITQFMKKFAKEVGPLPEQATRAVLLAQCVNRAFSDVETIETNAFEKAFPSTPCFSMAVYGEYGMMEVTEVIPKKRAKKAKGNISFLHCDTSCYIVLTVDNSK